MASAAAASDQGDRAALEPLAPERGARARASSDRADHHHEQERRALQEREVGVSEIDLDVAGGERADDQRGQKGPNAHRRGDADPLEDVEDEMHRAVP